MLWTYSRILNISASFEDDVVRLRANKLSVELQAYPDRDFVNSILQGIATGFWIGCNHGQSLCKLNIAMPDDTLNVYLQKELCVGRTIIPERVEINFIGLSQYHLIVHISSPNWYSVSVDIAEKWILSCIYVGPYSFLTGRYYPTGNANIKEAYHTIIVHYNNKLCLGKMDNSLLIRQFKLPLSSFIS